MNASNAAPTRREREREQHKHEILDAAEEIFAARGFAEATLEDIAKKADFAVGSIYNFFNGKSDLMYNVILRLTKVRVAEVAKVAEPASAEPLGVLRALVEQSVAFYARHGAFMRVAFIARIAEGKFEPPGGAGEEDLRELIDAYEALCMRVFENGIRSGVFHPLTPRCAFTIFEGICRAFLFLWKKNKDMRSVAEFSDELFAATKIALTGRA